MIELEVYAAGIRDLNKVLQLDHEMAALSGLRYKVDTNHDIVYMEMDEPSFTIDDIKAIFQRLSLEPRFVGLIPPQLRSKSKTQPLN